MLKKFKQATLKSLKTSGVSTAVQNSRWRRRRLLILAYHGISLQDEHLWDGTQFLSADVFRARLQLLKNKKCALLPLAEALERLYQNDLPDKAVAITFDDGNVEFATKAFPLLKEFDFPVTLYLTTFYSHYQRPVFDVMCSYLLWKGRDEILDLGKIIGREARIRLVDPVARETTSAELRAFAREQKLSAEEKDQLAASLAARLKVDYEALLERRALHILKPEEISRLASQGVDIQLHTHRHRTPMDRQLFLREIEDNRKSIREMTGRSASQFCYPSGSWRRTFLPWLREAGIESATTCEHGLASPSSNPLLLPRMIDVSSLSAIEFESWLTGISGALPRRPVPQPRAA
jgi:peptidoglycan/xylan/chitin deacetylase (PgdA/CDA1 family)